MRGAAKLTSPPVPTRWFHQHPDLAWGFWGRCHQAYTRARPHAGYALLAGWARRAPLGGFSVTSNVDGHWARIAIGHRVT